MNKKSAGLSDTQINYINSRLTGTLIRRKMVRYFVDKGLAEEIDNKVSPLDLVDLSAAVPEISDRIELVPHIKDINPQSGHGKVGWNLFVDGSKRMYLGQIEYSDMSEFARQLSSGQGGFILPDGKSHSYLETTPRKIIAFVVREMVESGTVRGVDQSDKEFNQPLVGKTMNRVQSSMFNKNQPIRPE